MFKQHLVNWLYVEFLNCSVILCSICSWWIDFLVKSHCSKVGVQIVIVEVSWKAPPHAAIAALTLVGKTWGWMQATAQRSLTMAKCPREGRRCIRCTSLLQNFLSACSLLHFDALIRNPSYSVEAWGTTLFGRGGESQYYLAFTFTFIGWGCLALVIRGAPSMTFLGWFVFDRCLGSLSLKFDDPDSSLWIWSSSLSSFFSPEGPSRRRHTAASLTSNICHFISSSCQAQQKSAGCEVYNNK